MNVRIFAAAILGLGVVAGVSTSVVAQENQTTPLKLSGTYQIRNVAKADDGTVNMDFSATITNGGSNDLSGQILLRDSSDNEKVWGRFGDRTILAGGKVTVSGNVTVPKAIFASWSNSGRPPVFLYTQDPQGGLTMFNVPLSGIPVSPPSKG